MPLSPSLPTSPSSLSSFLSASARAFGLLLVAAALTACTTQAPSQTEPVQVPRVSTTPETPSRMPRYVPLDTRDAQGRVIAAHFAPPAGAGAQVAQAHAAGTYRVVLGTLAKGGWRVQDFYEISGKPFSDAFVLQREADIARQPAESIDGWLRQYYHSGARKLVQMYRNGKAEGTASTYYPGNKRKGVVIYRDGRPAGVGTFWHANGKLALKVTFRNGRAVAFRGWSEGGGTLPSDLAQSLYERLSRLD